MTNASETIALRCRCGKLRGRVDGKRVAARAVCYCKDCQAYGHFLGTGVLDPAGGTEVAATLPAAVRFDEGGEQLACMSLGPNGIYRWYARCCRTPIGNTPRDPRTAYVGLVRACLDAPDEQLARALGPLRCRVRTQSAAADRPAGEGGRGAVAGRKEGADPVGPADGHGARGGRLSARCARAGRARA